VSSADWDGIILGAGHNALVLQAYLGKAGLPGGNVTALVGYDCGQVLLRDLSLEAR